MYACYWDVDLLQGNVAGNVGRQAYGKTMSPEGEQLVQLTQRIESRAENGIHISWISLMLLPLLMPPLFTCKTSSFL